MSKIKQIKREQVLEERRRVAELYRQRKITAMQACEMLGIKKVAFYAFMKNHMGFARGTFSDDFRPEGCPASLLSAKQSASLQAETAAGLVSNLVQGTVASTPLTMEHLVALGGEARIMALRNLLQAVTRGSVTPDAVDQWAKRPVPDKLLRKLCEYYGEGSGNE